MRTFVLGGYGKTGRPVVELLAADESVTKIAVAGRNLDQATAFAAAVGDKAVAVQADGTTEDTLASQLTDYDIVLNAASTDTTMPALRAAIRTGVDYCDVVTFENEIDRAIELSPEAESAGITAVVANGVHPSVTNLMGVHSAHQLDQIEQLQLGDASMYEFENGRDLTPKQWRKDPQESLATLADFRGGTEWQMHMVSQAGARTARDYTDGRWVEVDPVSTGVVVPQQDGGNMIAHPHLSTAPLFGALPTDLGAAPPVEMLFSPLPPQLHDRLRELATRVLQGDIEAGTAMDLFFATIEGDPDHWLTLPADYLPSAKTWARAVGVKDGKAARATCWFTPPAWDVGGYLLTSVALVAAARMVLRGDVLERGVTAAETAFDPLSFFTHCAYLLGDYLPDGELVRESFEYLA